MTYDEYMTGQEVTLSLTPTASERLEEETALPVTPSEIAATVGECAEMGTTIASVYGWTEEANQDPAALPTVGTAINETVDDVLVEYAVGPDCHLGDYLDALDGAFTPDLARIRVSPGQHGSRGVTRRSRRDVDRFIRELQDRDIEPNLLVQSGRDIQEVYRLLNANVVSAPVVTLRLGARDGTVATPLMLMALLDSAPQSATVMVGATGPNQYPLTSMAVFLGAHVRTGLGDNRYLAVDQPAENNRELVKLATELINASNRSISEFETVAEQFGRQASRVEIS